MVKGKQTKLIEMLYEGEIQTLAYEIYQGSDIHPHVRTYAILNDEFKTQIKLEELGQLKDKLLEELKNNNYINISKENTHTLKKVA